MHLYHHVDSLRQKLRAEKKLGKTVGFVPTMGNLHSAHLALVEEAHRRADVVVVSIFVNRLQFGLNEDWDKYPRTLDADTAKLQESHCDVLFCPDESEIYPNGMDTQTRVIVPTMADILCGSSRPGHFEGVTTVVNKLFNIVQPDVAIFGLKDYQQLAIIRRMVEDLCLPVDIIAGEIVRESDGLAMSSRNSYILEEERSRATVLYRSLVWLKQQIQGGSLAFADLEVEAKQKIVEAGFQPDYVTVCESHSLALAAHDDKSLTIAGAMYTQAARLIDNVTFTV